MGDGRWEMGDGRWEMEERDLMVAKLMPPSTIAILFEFLI